MLKAYNIYMAILVKVDNLSVNYFGGYEGISSVSFEMQENEILPFFGRAYSGKSSLLRAIAGLEKVSEGEVIFSTTIDKDMVYSFSYKSLSNNKLVKDVLFYPLKIRGIQDFNIVLTKARYYKIENLLDKKIKQLTKEQKILVCLCRAMLRECKLYILDNPLFELDANKREEYFELLKEDIKNKSVIYATDIIEEAFSLNEKVGIISFRKLHQLDTKENMLNYPHSISVLNCLDISTFAITKLEKENDEYKYSYNGKIYNTSKPINDVYLNKEIIIPIINGDIRSDIYFDKESEYIASRGKDGQ